MAGRSTAALAVLVTCAMTALGCASEDAGGLGPDPGPGVIAGETYMGIYEVPVPPRLAGAASFPVAEVNWKLAGGRARLAYNLPLGLVGRSVRVSFEGSVDGAGTATLTGTAGSSVCSISASGVTCSEIMRGLLPMRPDLAVIEALAGQGGVAVQDRLDVAVAFSEDPIGIVKVDLTAPVSPEAEVEVETP